MDCNTNSPDGSTEVVKRTVWRIWMLLLGYKGLNALLGVISWT